ncbi:hypothetical protein [Salinisphaera orenii]|uniref:hypothetical protein n=1 Tax=Salinisphaera orenii TaxID=856731 RepID=UPI0013A65DC4
MSYFDSTYKADREMAAQYSDAFGPVSEGLPRVAANQGQHRNLIRGMADSVRQGKDLLADGGSDNYVTPWRQFSQPNDADNAPNSAR